MMSERVIALSPGAAASVLGVSPQTLRRYALFYEAVHGPLPHRGGHRAYTQEALERLRAAQALVNNGQAAGMQAALELLKDGPPPVVVAPKPVVDAELVGEVAGLRSELGEVRAGVGTVLEEFRALMAELEPVIQGAPSRAELSGLREDMDRLVAAMVELAQRHVEKSADLANRIEALEGKIDALLQEPNNVSPSRWPFKR